jgi:hypothetical protein
MVGATVLRTLGRNAALNCDGAARRRLLLEIPRLFTGR